MMILMIPSGYALQPIGINLIPNALDIVNAVIDPGEWLQMINEGNHSDSCLRLWLMTIISIVYERSTARMPRTPPLFSRRYLRRLDETRVIEKSCICLWTAFKGNCLEMDSQGIAEHIHNCLFWNLNTTCSALEERIVEELISDNQLIRKSALKKLTPYRTFFRSFVSTFNAIVQQHSPIPQRIPAVTFLLIDI
ncbi:unnamed protein product [Caenorhabditis bovis]|uniref:Uncharacterized protein n=1 Tax=Caenorhabditis bovis TaxID=2654633 RepID=A0A8S1FCQ4_9PELO|nr:unnamed protein product [Caenorhabditis bovis]